MTPRISLEVDVSEDVGVYIIDITNRFIYEASCDRCKWSTTLDDRDAVIRHAVDHRCDPDRVGER